ncbi:MAG TPA: M3 family oligoendopeptidase [Planctomycetota bacterium]|nr:M3 family oligoendopeptidase [Planctomycetota bacterium]
MTTAAFESPKVHWNLSDLFSGINDPRIEQNIAEQKRRAEEFAKKYRGRINSPDLTAATLADAIAEYESISQESAKPGNFAGLLFACNSKDPEIGAFMQKMQEKGTELSIILMFFELELLAADEALMTRLTADVRLAPYRHYITTARAFRSHTLSEPEEKIMEELSNTGGRAFCRLFTEVTSNAKFKVQKADGTIEELTQPEVLARLRNPDREVRRRASEGFTNGLRENGRVLTFIFNTLLQDKATRDRLRKHTSPEESRHLSNELDNQTVETVVSAVEKNAVMVARYYRLKRKLLNLPELTHYDRYAPLFDTAERIPWDEGRDIVLGALGEFSPVVKSTAEEFFTGNWIDAEVRPGKRGGAFCSYITPDLHPYVMVNYLGKMDDVSTLAHELGHGVHASLSRGQSYFNFHGTLPLAELASTFAEMLVFEKLQKRASAKDRLALYADKIEGAFATIFRQSVMYRFEQDIHRHRREKGELTAEQFGDYWQKRQQSMFADSVVLGEDHKLWWSYIPHFIGSPFYVYAYSFGELLVMALFQQYKRKGGGFAEEYVTLLKKGGSLSPQELMQSVGIDIKDPAFWQGGLDVLGEMVREFEKMQA